MYRSILADYWAIRLHVEIVYFTASKVNVLNPGVSVNVCED